MNQNKKYKNLNKIICGDCLEEMAKLHNRSIDCVITDPPYGTTACKWDTIIPFDPMWEQLKRITKKNGAIVLFGSQPFTSALVMSNPKMFKYEWVWKKDKAANWMFGNKMPLKIYENISVFYENQPTYNPQKRINPEGISKRHLYKNPSKITQNVKSVMGENWAETKMNETENYHGKNYEPDKLLPTTELYFAREQKGKLHPTQKPVELGRYLVRTYTNEGDTVLDFTAGSGSFGVAAILEKRNFIGIEKDEHYCEVARKRIQEAQEKLSTNILLRLHL